MSWYKGSCWQIVSQLISKFTFKHLVQPHVYRPRVYIIEMCCSCTSPVMDTGFTLEAAGLFSWRFFVICSVCFKRGKTREFLPLFFPFIQSQFQKLFSEHLFCKAFSITYFFFVLIIYKILYKLLFTMFWFLQLIFWSDL